MGKLLNAIKRVMNVMFGWMFKGVEKLEASNPEAMLALERQKFEDARAKYNQGRAQTRAHEVRIERQIEGEEAQAKKLAATVKGLLTKMKTYPQGSDDFVRFQSAAAAKSGELKRLRVTLEQNKEQLAAIRAQAEEQTKQYRVQTKAYERKLEEAKRLVNSVKMKKTMAEFHEATSDLSFEAGEGMGSLMESLRESEAQAEGKIRVAQENSRDNMDFEIEQAALEAQDADALSEMMAEFGMEDDVQVIKPASLPPASSQVEVDVMEAEFEQVEAS